MPVDDVIEKMNEYGSNRFPFLFIIDYELEKPLLFTLEEIKEKNIKFSFNGTADFFDIDKIFFEKYPIDFISYKSSFDLVIKKIESGYSYLANLTFPTRIETNLTLDDIYRYCSAKYKLLYENQFVLFSPECFVKIEDGIISSYPMKGTIDASIPDAENIIMNDEKEIAEHTTIVDLIRNDLSIVANNVRVEEFRYIEKIKTNEKNLLQVSSKIRGDLEKNYNKRIGEIIFNMLPAGSISGAPKKKTVEIISAAEKGKRGYYSGVFGLFDGVKLDSAVMIRFIENTNEGMFYRSGGGITYLSNAESEYNELIDKVYVPINRSH